MTFARKMLCNYEQIDFTPAEIATNSNDDARDVRDSRASRKTKTLYPNERSIQREITQQLYLREGAEKEKMKMVNTR